MYIICKIYIRHLIRVKYVCIASRILLIIYTYTYNVHTVLINILRGLLFCRRPLTPDSYARPDITIANTKCTRNGSNFVLCFRRFHN